MPSSLCRLPRCFPAFLIASCILWSTPGHAAPRIAAGFALAVGSQPHAGLSALTADLFPVELRLRYPSRRLAFQLDLMQLLIDSLLTSRRRVGLSAFHHWSHPVHGGLSLDGALGLDTEFGLQRTVVAGHLSTKPSLALGPSARLGVDLTGGGDRFHLGVYFRGTLGPEFSVGDSGLFARALVETTLVWGPGA